MSSTISALYLQISERFGKNVEELAPDTTLESLGIDSLEKIELIFDLEDHFKVRIPNENVKIETLQDVANLIDSAR